MGRLVRLGGLRGRVMVVCIAALPFYVRAQTATATGAAQAQNKIQVHTEEVIAPVTVLDKRGGPVLNLAQKDFHPDKGGGGLTRDPAKKTGTYSPTGSWGDPTLATREKGEVIVEALVKDLVSFIQAFSSDTTS